MASTSTADDLTNARGCGAAPARVAIVEDDDHVGALLHVLFERAGFVPVLLPDGRAAEEYVAAHGPPSAVILDANLPYRDGFSVARTIRGDARWRAVPIVMLSGRKLEGDVARARRCGIEHHVAKPFRPAALVALVRSVVGEAP